MPSLRIRARSDRAAAQRRRDLETEQGDLVQAEISQQEQRHLVLARGDAVYVRPREFRHFGSVEDYSI